MRLIDGDALMERLGIAYDCRECDQDKPPYCTWKPDVVDVCQIIADAPTIEERKKGKWIKREIGWKCSNCTLCTNDRGADSFNFCPNCGSDMREGDQDE